MQVGISTVYFLLLVIKYKRPRLSSKSGGLQFTHRLLTIFFSVQMLVKFNDQIKIGKSRYALALRFKNALRCFRSNVVLFFLSLEFTCWTHVDKWLSSHLKKKKSQITSGLLLLDIYVATEKTCKVRHSIWRLFHCKFGTLVYGIFYQKNMIHAICVFQLRNVSF